jgi:glycosyltransferase involved in cell wall biosynthesis
MTSSQPTEGRPLRVLIVSPSYDGGGAERCARELFQALVADPRVEPTLAVRVGPRTPQPGVVAIDTAVDRLLNHVTLLPGVHDWTRRAGARFLRSIKRQDFDVVHLHGVVHCGLPLRGLSDLAARFPTVWTLHDEWAVTKGVAYDLRHCADPRDRKRCSRHTCFAPDFRSGFVTRQLAGTPIQPRVMIAPSRWLLGEAEQSRAFTGAEFRMVRNGLRLLDEPARRMPKEAARQALGIPTDRPVALLIASALAVPYKGMRYAVDALNQITANTTVPPAIILCGTDAARIRRELPQNLSVFSTFAATNEELCRVYRAADCTVMPSLADNFPYVAIESLACETPIVAADCVGLKEIVQESGGGTIAKAADSFSLAAAISASLSDLPKQASTRASGRAWVESHCGMVEYCEAIIAAYRTCIGAVAGPRHAP